MKILGRVPALSVAHFVVFNSLTSEFKMTGKRVIFLVFC